MHLRSIELRNLFSHKSSSVTLPAQGVVVVTGPNGAGKSSLAECVAVAGWGKTLRGSPPWAGSSSTALLRTTEGLRVERIKKNKGSPKLIFRDGSTADSAAYTTTTKAQAALEALIGPFDVWRRSHVFSSSDAAHFTLATDAERKRLLESILGLDRFDPALKRCRADLRTAQSECREAEHTLALYETRLTNDRLRVKEATEALRLFGPPPTLIASSEHDALCDAVKRYGAAIDDIKKEMASTRAEQVQGGIAFSRLQQDVAYAKAREDKLSSGHCPECEQSIPASLTEALRATVNETEQLCTDRRVVLELEQQNRKLTLEELQDELCELQDQREQLQDKVHKYRGEKDAADRYAVVKAKTEQTRAVASRRVAALEKDVQNAKADVARLKAEVMLLDAAEKVLGLRGVRAHVLGEALDGLEVVANAWLDRLGGQGLRVKLSPYSSLKSGSSRDAIALELTGAGGGHGYKGASGGERRRVDVALLLAVAEVAGAANGKGTGTLFFDEVFDCLDEEGAEAVVDALLELSRDRCVVVVTHSARLASMIPATKHLHISDGAIGSGTS